MGRSHHAMNAAFRGTLITSWFVIACGRGRHAAHASSPQITCACAGRACRPHAREAQARRTPAHAGTPITAGARFTFANARRKPGPTPPGPTPPAVAGNRRVSRIMNHPYLCAQACPVTLRLQNRNGGRAVFNTALLELRRKAVER